MNETILIIEDNPDMRQNTAEILELASYKVLTASNGKEGIETAKKNRPDLILCDITMPELDGYGVLRALEHSEKLSSVPFIFITAKSEKIDFRKGMDLGADDYLTKPFNGDDLLRVVSTRLKKSHILRETYQHTLKGLNDFINQASALDELQNLHFEKTNRRVQRKSAVYMEGEMAHFLYFVITGKVKISQTNEEGKEFIRQIYKEGDFFGYLSLLDSDRKHKETATAIEDSEIALIPREDFFKLLYSSSDVSLKFIRFLTNNLADAQEKLLKLAYNSARKRVAEALLFLYKKYNAGKTADPSFPVHRENISAIAGISPESASRNLRDLKEEGLIEISQNGIIKILDLTRLQNLKG